MKVEQCYCCSVWVAAEIFRCLFDNFADLGRVHLVWVCILFEMCSFHSYHTIGLFITKSFTISPGQNGELALAKLCLEGTGGVVEVGQALSYSGDEDDGGGAGVGSGGDVDDDGEI